MMYRQIDPRSMNNSTSRQKLLKEISLVDFAIVELNLYLDTHPDDVDAVALGRRM